MSSETLLLSAVFAPFIGAIFAPQLGRLFKARAGYVLILAFLPTLLLLPYATDARNGTPLEASLAWVPSIGLDIGLRADGFSLLFALLVAGIGILILAYAAAYLGKSEKHGRFFSYLLIFGGAMLGLVLSDNLIALFAFWEMTSLSSFLLIGFWGSRRASQDGAVKALVITAIGGLALLVAVALLSVAGGTMQLSKLELVTLQQSPLFVPALIFLLLAAFTKSAQLPFHLWLPTAMEAPTPVSAYLHSATMVKAGVILVAKFSFLLDDSVFANLVMYVGLATMFWGSYLAMRQNDLKALLAYSTVSQLGILMSLYGAGHPFAATAHLVNHAAFKAALFMVVGIIDHEAGSRDITKLSGLRRKLPLTFAIALPATLSMAGLPIFGGFISKELFYEEMLHEGFLPIFIAVTGSIMTFAYCLRFLKVFFGKFKCENPNVHEAPPPLWLPAAPLTLAVIAFGIVALEPSKGFFTLTNSTVAVWFTNLAAPSFAYEAKKLYIWHGFNLALGLSALTWLLGTGLHLIRDRFHALQNTLTPSWNNNTIYYGFLDKLERFSSWFTRNTQGAPFAAHLRIVMVALALIGASVFWAYRPEQLTVVPLEFWLIAVAVVGSIVGVLSAQNRLSAIIFAGLAGLASTLAFVLLSAPDLALTQLLIETVTVILFLSVFRFLPRLKTYSRPRSMTFLDALLAVGVAATMFTTLMAVQTPIAERISGYFLEFSKSVAGGYNVVNVILVDFRGYDTMGEVVVLGVVAVSVIALLRVAVKRAKIEPDTDGDPS